MNNTIKGDLKICKKKKEFESIFIEFVNSKGKNLTIGCIYWHPSMRPTEFIDIYISKLLWKFKKDKTIVSIGYFNIDLLKYDTNTDSTTLPNRSLCAISLEERLKIATHPLSYFNTILKFSMMLILTLN